MVCTDSCNPKKELHYTSFHTQGKLDARMGGTLIHIGKAVLVVSISGSGELSNAAWRVSEPTWELIVLRFEAVALAFNE